MYFEFQSKGSHAPVFKLKTPDFSETNLMGPDKKMSIFADGERVIAKVIDNKMLMSEVFYDIEDTEGNTATISGKNFHKITDPKNFSKKFKMFKVANHIVD